MHTPWLQIANEVREVNAPQLAADLDLVVGEAYLLLSDFIGWALRRCPEDRPPSSSAFIKGASAGRQLANGVGWRGDAKVLVDAIARLPYPMIELREDGIRIRGLKRYDHYWTKSYPEAAKAWKGSPQPAATPIGAETAPKPRRSTAETAPPDPDPDPDPEEEPTPKPPSTSELSVAERLVVVNGFKGAMADARQHAGFPLEPTAPKDFDAWALARHAEGFTPRDAMHGKLKFLRDETIRSRDKPTAVFIRNCWETRMVRLGPEPPPPTQLQLELHRRLEPLRADGHAYAAHQLGELQPVRLAGELLQLRAKDQREHDWCADHYADLLPKAGLELLKAPELAH